MGSSSPKVVPASSGAARWTPPPGRFARSVAWVRAETDRTVSRVGVAGVLLVAGSVLMAWLCVVGQVKHRRFTNPGELPSGPAVLSPDPLVNEMIYEFFVAASSCLTQVDVFALFTALSFKDPPSGWNDVARELLSRSPTAAADRVRAS